MSNLSLTLVRIAAKQTAFGVFEQIRFCVPQIPQMPNNIVVKRCPSEVVTTTAIIGYPIWTKIVPPAVAVQGPPVSTMIKVIVGDLRMSTQGLVQLSGTTM